MEVNIPDIVAEVTTAFARYEAALMANDTAALDALFWTSPHTIRYGVGENLHGIDEIRAFRTSRATTDLARELGRTVITTFGRDAATASTLYRRVSSGRTGRQMQTWIRTDQGWRVVAAHVSMADIPWSAA